jgi:membrane protease subunit HflK
VRFLRLLLLLLGLGLLGAAYAYLGFFTVSPDERTVVLRLGRYARTVGPGLHWLAPLLERHESYPVVVQREEFGFRTVSAEPPQQYEERPEERRMLTGDESLIDIQFVVQYRVDDLHDYVVNVRDTPGVVRDVAQASMRDVVARHPVQDALTERKGAIEAEARERMRELLRRYGAGIEVLSVQLQDVEVPDPVKEAFRDVVSAEQDRGRLILEAEVYAQQMVPRARGEAEAMVNDATGYRDRAQLRARGEAARFEALLDQYRKAPGVTRERLYIEALEEVLPRMDKVIVEDGLGDKILPYLPLGSRRGSE